MADDMQRAMRALKEAEKHAPLTVEQECERLRLALMMIYSATRHPELANIEFIRGIADEALGDDFFNKLLKTTTPSEPF